MKRVAPSIPVSHKAGMEHDGSPPRKRSLVRLVLRPFRGIARRVRWYFVAGLGAELAASLDRQRAIQARQDYIVGMQDIILGRLTVIEQLIRESARDDQHASVVAERLMLTLALEEGRLPEGGSGVPGGLSKSAGAG